MKKWDIVLFLSVAPRQIQVLHFIIVSMIQNPSFLNFFLVFKICLVKRVYWRLPFSSWVFRILIWMVMTWESFAHWEGFLIMSMSGKTESQRNIFQTWNQFSRRMAASLFQTKKKTFLYGTPAGKTSYINLGLDWAAVTVPVDEKLLWHNHSNSFLGTKEVVNT